MSQMFAESFGLCDKSKVSVAKQIMASHLWRVSKHFFAWDKWKELLEKRINLVAEAKVCLL